MSSTSLPSSSVASTAPPVPSLLSLRGKIVVAAVLAILVVVIPALNVMVPATSAFHLSDYAVSLLGKIMCYAICALAMDLIWGYTGILSLGHGLFFALGKFLKCFSVSTGNVHFHLVTFS